jgi:MOSC domain-containing protein YiiM
VVTRPHVVSVQIGPAVERGTRGARELFDREWRSAIVKQPVDGPVRVTSAGIDGDEHADTVNHGGVDKALLAYSAENLASWAPLLGEVPAGGFGENLTVSGLDETEVCIGDRFTIGAVVVECSQPRQPCWKLDRRWRRRDLSARVIENGHSGWYLRVLEPGVLAAGVAVTLVDRPHPGWPVARAARIMHRVDGDADAAAELAAIPQLARSWRETLSARAR